MADLAFFAADTLGMALYAVKGRLVASEMHPIHLGPWKADMQIDVESDVVSGASMGFWMTIAKKLRLYVIVKEKESWLFVLDEAKLKEQGSKTSFAAETLKARVKEFKPAIKGVFRWKGAEWEGVEYDGSVTE